MSICGEDNVVSLSDKDEFYCVCLGRYLTDECELTYCQGYDDCPYRLFIESDPVLRKLAISEYNACHDVSVSQLKVRPIGFEGVIVDG